MMEKLIEHLSKEIQTVTETTMTFRTRIAFFVWIGPFLILSSIVVGTKGLFRVDLHDFWFQLAMAAFSISYIGLGVLGWLIEHGAWKRCDVLRRKIIEYAKLESVNSIKPEDKDILHPDMTKRVGYGYLCAFICLLIGFLSAALAVSRLEFKSPGDGVIATPNGKSVSVILPIKDYEELLASGTKTQAHRR